MSIEPDIIINNKQLSDAQAMTIRVACSVFFQQLSDEKELVPIDLAYLDRLNEVLAMMYPRSQS